MVDHSSPPRPPLSTASLIARLAGIGAVVAVMAGAFAYVNGSLDLSDLGHERIVSGQPLLETNIL